MPKWSSREDALDYLRQGFGGWLDLLMDLVNTGAHIDSMMAVDLMAIADGLADFLEDPSREVLAECVPVEYVSSIGRTLSGVHARLEAPEFDTTDGLGCALAPNTLKLLSAALENATLAYRREAERWRDGEDAKPEASA